MLRSLENLQRLFENKANVQDLSNDREVTEQEVINLKSKLDKVRFWAYARGARADYAQGPDYPDGYVKEIEVPVESGGLIMAGSDVLNTYALRSMRAYLNFSFEKGTIRFVEYFKQTVEPVESYTFAIADPEDQEIFRVDFELLTSMRKGIYDVVNEMADLTISKAQAVFIPQETTAA
jgi:hypothetical protein